MNFPDKIKSILKKYNFNYRVRVFQKKENVFSLKKGKYVTQDYDKVIIYAGRNIEKYAQKRSRRLIAWKNPDGEWEGDLEALRQFGHKDSDGNYIGTSLYVIDYHDKTEPLKKVLFSDLWEDNEKDFGKGSQEKELLKVLESWSFQEKEERDAILAKHQKKEKE